MYFLGLEEVQKHKIIVQVSVGTGGDARRYNHSHKCLLGMRQVQENGILMYVLLQD